MEPNEVAASVASGTISTKLRAASQRSATTAPDSKFGEHVTYQVVEHMIATLEAKTEAKLTEVRSHADKQRLELVAQIAASSNEIKMELAKKPGTGTFVATVIGAIAVVVGVLAFGGDRFDGGVQLTSVSVQQAQEARDLSVENARQLKALLDRMDKAAAAVP